jgi:hypothetical protein
VGQRADIDNAGPGCRLLQQRHQQVGEQKVAKVVGANLHLKALLGPLLGTGHHARIVQQDVNFVEAVVELFSTATDTLGEDSPIDFYMTIKTSFSNHISILISCIYFLLNAFFVFMPFLFLKAFYHIFRSS